MMMIYGEAVNGLINYHLLSFTTKFSPILIGLIRSRDAIVFVRGETLSADSARPQKIPGWIVLVGENTSVNKRAYRK